MRFLPASFPPIRLLALALATLLGGCAQTPRLDSQFGQSLQQLRRQQTLDPQAGQQRRNVSGMDADSAGAAYDNYVRSYRTPEKQNNFTIGTGGSTR